MLKKVVSANSSSFVQSVRECSQDFFCGVVTPSWQMLMDNCEAEHLQSTQPEGLDEDVCSLALGDGTANLAEKLFLLATLLIGSHADTALLVQVQL